MSSTTDIVREFYMEHPYPHYGFSAFTRGPQIYKHYCTKEGGTFLEAGCGTGHGIAGAAVVMPHLEFYGVDLSENSLNIARQVAEANNVKVDLRQANLMEALPFDFKFDYILSTGVLHHVENPEQGLATLVASLADDGYIFIHVYGETYHRRRFEIKEMLDYITGGSDDLEERYRLFKAYQKHEKRRLRGSVLRRLYTLSLRDVRIAIRKRLSRTNFESSDGAIEAWDSEWPSNHPTERWLDQFAHPNERAYNAKELHEWVGKAGLEIVEMFRIGRDNRALLPSAWKNLYEGLDSAKQHRVMELLHPGASFFFAARKLPTPA